MKLKEATVESSEVVLSPESTLMDALEGFEAFPAKDRALDYVILGESIAVRSLDRRMSDG